MAGSKSQEILEKVSESKTGNLKVGGRDAKTRTFYIRGNAKDKGGRFSVIEQSTNKKVGITNFDGGNKLNAQRDIIILGIKVSFDTVADSLENANFKSDAPVAFRNGELRLIQDKVLFDNPISVMCNKEVANVTPDGAFYKIHDTMILSQKEFDIEIELPKPIAADCYYNIELLTTEFVG